MSVGRGPRSRVESRTVEAACSALDDAIAVGRGAFTIGRTAYKRIDTLANRYVGGRYVVELWRGVRERAVVIERELQLYARMRHPERLANQNIGGGRLAADSLHVVYVVLWGDCVPTAPVLLAPYEGSVGERRARVPRDDRRVANARPARQPKSS